MNNNGIKFKGVLFLSTYLINYEETQSVWINVVLSLFSHINLQLALLQRSLSGKKCSKISEYYI